MDIKINERIIIIVGPTCAGKTTLANRIKASTSKQSVIISHDDVLATINPNQSQKAIDNQFRLKLLDKIVSAINDERNDYIILDTLNISQNSLSAFLSVIMQHPCFSSSDNIVVLKIFPTLTEHLSYLEKRISSGKVDIQKHVLTQQRKFFKSQTGSLNARFAYCNEHTITNLEKVNIIV